MILCARQEAIKALSEGLQVQCSYDSGNTWATVEDLDLLQSNSRFTAYRREVSNSGEVEKRIAEAALAGRPKGIHLEAEVIYNIFLDCHQDLAASRLALSYTGEDYYSNLPTLRGAGISKAEEHLADLVTTILAAAEELGWKVTEAIQLKSIYCREKEKEG